MTSNRIRKASFPAIAASVLALVSLVVMLPATQAAAKAPKKVTVTFNAAGGKVGAKASVKKKVVKGKKVGKLPIAKRTAYSFKGWFSKRSGGRKIAASTKIGAKSTFYARWVRVLSAADRQLVGKWSSRRDTPFDGSGNRIEFWTDGTFLYTFRAIVSGEAVVTTTGGEFTARSGRIIGTNIKNSYLRSSGKGNYKNRPGKNLSWSYEFAERPYATDIDNEAWLNGAPWLNIKMSPQFDSRTAQYESFQRPDA